MSYDCRPAPQHVMSWHLGQIRRGAVHVAGVPTMVAHGPADHTYEVAASAEDPASRVGRSRPIASFGLFHGVLLCAKGLTLVLTYSTWWMRLFRNELGRARSALAANPLGV